MTHFDLAELLAPLALDGTCNQIFDAPFNCRQEAINSLDAYLRQARWHSDTQPLRILQARKMCQDLNGTVPAEPGCQG